MPKKTGPVFDYIRLLEDLKEVVGNKIDSSLKPLKQDNKEIKTILFTTNKRLGGVEHKVGKLDNRVGKLEHKVGKLDTRLGKVEHKVDKMDTRLGGVEHRMGKVEHRLEDVEAGLLKTNKKLTNVETHLTNHVTDTDKKIDTFRKEMNTKLDRALKIK